MKKITRLINTHSYRLVATCLFVLGFTFLSLSQNNVWIYDSADNATKSVKIIERGAGVSEVSLLLKKDHGWQKCTIVSIDIIQEYIKVQLTSTKEIYELFIDWSNDKIVVMDSKNHKKSYWLRKA